MPQFRSISNALRNDRGVAFVIATICHWWKLRPNNKILYPNDFAELKPRNFVRMARLHPVDARLLVQMAGTLLPVFDVWSTR